MDETISRTLTVSVSSMEEAFHRALAAAERIDAGGEYQGEYRSFETLPQLFEVFTSRRWTLLYELKRLGPSTLRGLARALGRDVKRVHEDADILLKEGIIERNEDKKLFVPFAEIKIEATLTAPGTAAA